MNRQALVEFVAWAQANITGDEKGQAQVFLDRFFLACGRLGCIEAGGTLEYRVKKGADGGVAFADYVWKPVVLIEMKKRGTVLQRHYRQAFDYWTRLVPGRPRYVVLCNFDEFQVYDFETQMDAPVDTVALAELPDRYGALQFLAPGSPEPIFANDRVAVTRQAADRLATCFNHMVQRRVDRAHAQRFVLQMLVAFFAEDIGLLPKYCVAQLLADCKRAEDSYDLLGGLFHAMNSDPPEAGGRYKGIPYFNGGLFAKPAKVELSIVELNLLREAAKDDWSRIQPEVFGTLFQHSMDAGERHAYGAHFTHPADIMKIVGPTIVEPWREQIEEARSLRRLQALSERLQAFRVLDPACGSGNFLYVAYRELKRLEARLFERMAEYASQVPASEQRLGLLSAHNFYGMDILPFAVEIAKVTMMIARKLAIDEVHTTEEPLPLDNLDANFLVMDALLGRKGQPPPWPAADVIIGNPPFLGAKKLKPEHGRVYVSQLRQAYPDVPGMADYCVYWIRRAHAHLPPCTGEDPVAGRAGLVGTQNIRNNESRVGGLDYVVRDGTIVEAVDNQPWSGEANVHVAIVNWVKTQNPALLPAQRQLWTKAEAKPQSRRKRGEGPAAKEFELAGRSCAFINSALSDQTDVSGAATLPCNVEPPCVFNGQFPRHHGFVLDPDTAASLLEQGSRNREVVHPFLVGAHMLTHLVPQRWVIDFQKKDILDVQQYEAPFQHVRTRVLPHVSQLGHQERTTTGKVVGQDQQWLKTWWQHFRCRKELIDLIGALPRYLTCCEVTKRPIMCFVDSRIRPDHTLEVFTLSDDYSYGILQSACHWRWFTTKCSKLTERFRYTPESVFNTFPWPQAPTPAQVAAVAAAGREIRRIRAHYLPRMRGGLRALYRTLELPGRNPLKDAHAALDEAVLAAYGFSAGEDLLAQLLSLNLEVAARAAAGSPVAGPGVPPGYPDPAALISADCIQPPAV